ncbi:hypothetical protein VC83_05137 [Pseudogymnoascus destructans]|uniref:Yeast cell wall synthesis Kre9/Knh1-like N-terminal domain-containing protein n=2 Tax=Pseudogymnoascus destructans TaxID=655981 RepID=L8GBE9_PSED2|nr:uncharacterized protein VC83_05137 [Pseudogymnoascus destructans]ELR10535.1 hypothetical protein GMDG_04810 [Pseudogymnoascus destructans 20631-21]OAF58579.1 hypothetical protein VC83_05137 [Pseudogymnoascus destructans]
MQYSFAKACLLALATTTSVLAQIPGFNVLTAPTSQEVIPAGSTFTIRWTPSNPPAPITLFLIQGKDAQSLNIADKAIASSIDSSLGHFDWAVPASAPFAAYGILLQLDSNHAQFQYSNPFTISGGAGGSTSETGAKGAISISAAEPTGGKSTTTINVSQISTAPTTSSTKAASTSTKAAPSTTSEKASSTAESTTKAASTTETPSTKAASATEAPSTKAPTTPPSATHTGAAPRSAIGGSGLLGAMVMVFALF